MHPVVRPVISLGVARNRGLLRSPVMQNDQIVAWFDTFIHSHLQSEVCRCNGCLLSHKLAGRV